MTLEELYLVSRDQKRTIDYLTTRLEVIELFLKRQYPEYFAGEVGTICDPDLNPIPIVFGTPQEENRDTWQQRNIVNVEPR